MGMSLLVQELSAVSEMWQYIGEELGVARMSLDNIRTRCSDDDEDCLREICSYRLQSNPTTWRDIIAALRSSRIGKSHLANQLEAKYRIREYTMIVHLNSSVIKPFM